MPMLTPSQVHIDAPLTNLTLAYLQSADNFIADKVFPVVDVDKQSDKYYIYDRENFNRSGQRKQLAPRTRPERVGMSLSNDSYFADVFGLATDFDEQTLANEDAAQKVPGDQPAKKSEWGPRRAALPPTWARHPTPRQMLTSTCG